MKQKYRDIAQDIHHNIANGCYAEQMPAERALAAEFETTQTTVRKALELLTGEGRRRSDDPRSRRRKPRI